MNIVCVICSDLFTPSDDIFYTPCGHIFHFVCLTQWLERSKSCPQCREKTTSYKIHRIYFNFSNNDTIVEDSCSLQEKIDKLNLQLTLKEKIAREQSEKSEKLEKESRHLNNALKKLEKESKSAVEALKQQLMHFKGQSYDLEAMKNENNELKKQIVTYKNIETLLQSSNEEIDEMISQTTDVNTLITYISVMKREMTVSMNKRRELRSRVQSLHQELTKASMQKKSLKEELEKKKKVEEELIISETEKIALENKIRELEKSVASSNRLSRFNSKLNDNLDTSSQNESRTEGNEICNETVRISDCDREEERPTADKARHKDESNSSPYLPIKSAGVFVMNDLAKKRLTAKPNSSTLAKKPRTDQSAFKTDFALTYDGFGGHAKYDRFPSSSGAKIKTTKQLIFQFKR